MSHGQVNWFRDLEQEQETEILMNQQSNVVVDQAISFPCHDDIDIGGPMSSGRNSSCDTKSSSSGMSNSSSSSSGDVTNSCDFERPTKTIKTTNTNTGSVVVGYHNLPQSSKGSSSSSNSYILSFNNSQPILIKPINGKGNHNIIGRTSLENTQKKKEQQQPNKRNIIIIQEIITKKTTTTTTHVDDDSVTTRPPHRNAQDHIISERKRREKISQQFIALSALIPDLKKMDKASVLEDAIKHVKELQEKVEEEQRKWKNYNRLESVVVSVLKSKTEEEEDDVSETSSNGICKTNRIILPPQVEARVSEKNVLIRIHCENKQGVLMNIVKEIEENLHLSVTASNTLPFGTSKFYNIITIIAKMEEEFRLNVQELPRKLRVALLQFI